MHRLWFGFHSLGELEIYIGWGIHARTMRWVSFWPLEMQCSSLLILLVSWDDLAMNV